MICLNCGSIQANNIAACSVCGYEFVSQHMILPLSAQKTRLNAWEIILICILLFMILSNFLGIRITNIIGLPIIILGRLFGIFIFGIFYLIIIVLLSLVLVYGIFNRQKWAYYSIFAFCILSLVLMLTFGLSWGVGFQEIVSLFIVIVPIFLTNLKVYKEFQRGQNG